MGIDYTTGAIRSGREGDFKYASPPLTAPTVRAEYPAAEGTHAHPPAAPPPPLCACHHVVLDRSARVCSNDGALRDKAIVANSGHKWHKPQSTFMEDDNMKTNTNAQPTRTRKIASTLTRDTNKRHIRCPECGGVNGRERANQPCDFCGFFLTVRLTPDHDRYIRGLDATASGRDTYDIGDITADSLRGLNEDEVISTVAKALSQLPIEIALSVKVGRQFAKTSYTWTTNGIKGWLAARYDGRNPGMVRMNCGNILRGSYKRRDEIEG